jgi:hypothetical protein
MINEGIKIVKCQTLYTPFKSFFLHHIFCVESTNWRKVEQSVVQIAGFRGFHRILQAGPRIRQNYYYYYYYYYFTAIGFAPGGSSPTLVQKEIKR